MAKMGDAFRPHHRQLMQEMAQRAAALTGDGGGGDPESFVRFLRH